jgi:hypothetical protein
MLPEYGRAAGIAKAERALRDLTDAAAHLGIADRVTGLLVTLWDAFHPGGPPPLVRHKEPVLDKPAPDPTRKPQRGLRCNVDRVASPEGETVLQDVLAGLLSQREAARKLEVHPSAVCDAVRRLRQERHQQPADAAAETALTFSPTSH